MSAASEIDPQAAATESAPAARWPAVVGTIGIALGLLILYDTVQELWVHLTWTDEDWRRIIPDPALETVLETLPPMAVQLIGAVVDLALGGTLVFSSLWLRRRRPVGVNACRGWAWAAIAWAAVSISVAIWWLRQIWDDFPGLATAGWGPVTFGLGLAAAIMVAYPLFLLYWLSRSDVRAEYESWT